LANPKCQQSVYFKHMWRKTDIQCPANAYTYQLRKRNQTPTVNQIYKQGKQQDYKLYVSF